MVLKKEKIEVMTFLFLLLFISLILAAYLLNTLITGADPLRDFSNKYLSSKHSAKSVKVNENILNTFSWVASEESFKYSYNFCPKINTNFEKIARIRTRDFSYYVNLHNSNNVNEITDDLILLGDKNNVDSLKMILSFVQELEREVDADDRPKFPYETLFDLRGDCEDKSILAAYMLKRAGYDVAIIEFDDHVGLGLVDSTIDVPAKITSKEKSYVYLEPTTSKYLIGQIPNELAKSQKTVIFDLNNPNVIDLNWDFKVDQINSTHAIYDFNISLLNYGSIEALAKIDVYLTSKNSLLDKKTTSMTLKPNTEKETNFKLLFEKGDPHKMNVEIKGSSFNTILVSTGWI